jgi:hypothetical protein
VIAIFIVENTTNTVFWGVMPCTALYTEMEAHSLTPHGITSLQDGNGDCLLLVKLFMSVLQMCLKIKKSTQAFTLFTIDEILKMT